MSRKITNIFITGKIHIGKSTVLEKVICHYHFRELEIGGFRIRALIENGIHTGYVFDVINGESREFAHVDRQTNQKFDRYYVNPSVFEKWGALALQYALNKADVIILDEIGIIEKNCHNFKQLVFQCLDSDKIVLGIYQQRAKWFSESLAERNDTIVVEVSLKNRNYIHEKIIDQLKLN